MDEKLQIICDALVACLEEVPQEEYAQATIIVQQMILQLLHKLSGGKVTKVFFDHVEEGAVAVRPIPEQTENQECVDSACPVNEGKDEADANSGTLYTVTEVSETEAKEIELHIENPQDTEEQELCIENPHDSPEQNSAFKDAASVPAEKTDTKKPVLIKVPSEEVEQLLQAKCQRTSIHDGSQVFVCSVCQRPFKEKGKLKRHLLIHAGVKPFTCHICSKRFTQKTHLKDHLNTHTGERKNKCPDCGREFSFARNLHRHRKLHTKERPHSCSQCSASFVSSDKLYLHSLQHSGQKPHVCSACGRGFRRLDYLKGHKCSSKLKDSPGIRTIHLPAPRRKRNFVKYGNRSNQGEAIGTAHITVTQALDAKQKDNDQEQFSNSGGVSKTFKVKREDQSNCSVALNEANIIFIGSSDVQSLGADLQELIKEELLQESVVIRAPGTSLLKKNNITDNLNSSSGTSQCGNKPQSFSVQQILNQDNIQIMEIDTVVINDGDSQEVTCSNSGAGDLPAESPTAQNVSSPQQVSTSKPAETCSSMMAVETTGPLQTLIDAATVVANSQQDT